MLTVEELQRLSDLQAQLTQAQKVASEAESAYKAAMAKFKQEHGDTESAKKAANKAYDAIEAETRKLIQELASHAQETDQLTELKASLMSSVFSFQLREKLVIVDKQALFEACLKNAPYLLMVDA